MNIPEMWLVGRRQAWEKRGLAPKQALEAAIEDWADQERMSKAAAEMGRAKSERKAAASRENGRKGGRPRHTDYDRVLTLGIPRGLQREGERCRSCDEPAELLTCCECDREGWVINCGHYAQPRPIAAGRSDGSEMRRIFCWDCT